MMKTYTTQKMKFTAGSGVAREWSGGGVNFSTIEQKI